MPQMESKREPDIWQGERGDLIVSYPAKTVILFRYTGHISAGVMPTIVTSVDRVLRTRIRPDIFVDLYEVTGYDSQYRIEVTRWGDTIRERVGTFMLLVRSKLVAMGVSVSNLALGGFMTATAKRSQFDIALAAATRRGRNAVPLQASSGR